MSEFICTIGKADGSVVTRVVDGEAGALVRQRLETEGHRVFEIRKTGSHFKLPHFGRQRLPAQDFLIFNQELASLVRAGMPVLRALSLLQERRDGTHLGDILDRARQRIEGGSSLAEAFGAEGETVSPMYVTTLAIGETSGDLEGALDRYYRYLSRTLELRKRIQAAIVYPAILSILSLAVVVILLTYVMPRFAAFYASYEAELPMLTRALLGVSTAFVDAWPIWVAGGAFLLIAAFVWAPSDTGRAALARLVLTVPMLSRLQRRYLGVQLMRTLSVLLKGGTPMLPALDATRRAIANPVYRERLGYAGELVRAGNPLHAALEQCDLVDALAIEMVQVGESTGELDSMLEEIANHYDEALDNQLQHAVTMLEPALLVGIGLIVAAIVLAVYMPLFRVVQTVG